MPERQCRVVMDTKYLDVFETNYVEKCEEVQVPECDIVTVTTYVPVPDRECIVVSVRNYFFLE